MLRLILEICISSFCAEVLLKVANVEKDYGLLHYAYYILTFVIVACVFVVCEKMFLS